MLKRLTERHPVLTVILLMLITLTPMMALRDYTPSNELRYLSIVDEALADGHTLTFTNHGQDYACSAGIVCTRCRCCRSSPPVSLSQ